MNTLKKPMTMSFETFYIPRWFSITYLRTWQINVLCKFPWCEILGLLLADLFFTYLPIFIFQYPWFNIRPGLISLHKTNFQFRYLATKTYYVYQGKVFLNMRCYYKVWFNPNWHEGEYFYLLVLFGSDFVSWTFIENF